MKWKGEKKIKEACRVGFIIRRKHTENMQQLL